VLKQYRAGRAMPVPPLFHSSAMRLSGHRRDRVSIERLRPTQAVVGMRAVSAKLQRIGAHLNSAARIDRYLEKRPIPAVLGPSGNLYIVDRHHLSLALCQAEVEEAYVTVIVDFSSISRTSFWRCMEHNGMLHPYDACGRRISPARIPRRILNLGHDPYRDLAWSVRRRGGFDKTRVPFSEFRWADYFRKRICADLIERDYARAVRQAMQLTRARAARSLPGYAA
jgi:hypothetical protein